MSISYRVLGQAGRDNALLVQVDTGQAVERLLFDCGDGCLTELSFAEIQDVDCLFFSHLHMDHIGGFDSYFRCNFGRENKPNRIFGPPCTSAIVQHRFQGFMWNLHDEMKGTWNISDVHPDEIRSTRLELSEAFAVAHAGKSQSYERGIYSGSGYRVDAITMDHRTPSLAFIVRESARQNVDTSRLPSLGLRPGPWLKHMKEQSSSVESVIIDGVERSIAELRKALIVETPGESIAYLTDFLLDEAAMERLTNFLAGCTTVVCEGQYRHADLELAGQNHHMTSVLSATLAKRVGARELVLFHLSDRYDETGWHEMLEEARRIFPNTRYPEHWDLSERK